MSSDLLGQVQVSNIINFKRDINTVFYGFALVENEEYLIQKRATNFLVSKVLPDTIVQISEFSFEPEERELRPRSATEHNTRVLHQGELLVNMYENYIYIIDFMEGSLDTIIPLNVLGIKFSNKDVLVRNSKLYFSAEDINSITRYYEYDFITRNLDEIPFYKNAEIIRIDEKLYSLDSNLIINYDLLSEEEDTIFRFQSAIEESSNKIVKGYNSLEFKDKNGIRYFIRKDDLVYQTSCHLDEDIASIIRYIDGQISINLNAVSDTLFMTAIDLTKCEVIQSDTAFLRNAHECIGYKDVKHEEAKVLLITAGGNSLENDNYQILVDYEKFKMVAIPFLTFDFKEYESLLFGDKLFLMGQQLLHHSSGQVYCFYYDLNDSEVKKIVFDNDEWSNLHYVLHIDEKRSDQQINFYFQSYYLRGIGTYYINPDSISIITISDTANYGVINPFHHFSFRDKLYLQSDAGATVTYNDETSILIDKSECTKWVVLNNYAYTICSEYEYNTLYSVNLENDKVDSVLYERADGLWFGPTSITTSSVIFDNNKSEYFDINEMSFVDLTYGGVQLSPNLAYKSKENVIFTTESSGKKYYHFNSDTRQITQMDLPDDGNVNFYPDHSGGFLAIVNVDNKSIYYRISSESDLILIDEIDGIHSSIRTYYNTNDASFLQIYNEPHILVRQIAFDGILDYEYDSNGNDLLELTTLGFKNGKLIFEAKFEDENHLVFFEGSDFTLIQRLDINESVLLHTLTAENTIFGLYSNLDSVLSLQSYEFATSILSEVVEVKGRITDGKDYKSKLHPITSKSGLITFDNYLTGFEPFRYDFEENSFELIDNMKNGNLSSFPNYLMVHDQQLFFLALSQDNSYQIFRMDDLISSTNESYFHENVNLFFPNPSRGILYSDLTFESLSVYSLTGKLIKSFVSLPKGSSINLSDCKGMYILIGRTLTGGLVKQKVIIH